MADADEENPQGTWMGSGETDLTDETQDFRFLTSLTPQDPSSSKIPKRGEKDFEPHATQLQNDTLAASRAAMHAAISYPRTHQSKAHAIAYYDPIGGGSYIDKPPGYFHKSVGTVKKGEQAVENRLWLLPEETLHLLERGTLDVRWPSQLEKENPPDGETVFDQDMGIPMSLQGAYAAFLGMGSSPPTLEQYLVYAGLKRAGYVIFRANASDKSQPELSSHTMARRSPGIWGTAFFRELWRRIFSVSDSSRSNQEKLGPIVSPGLYRSYTDIYHLLQIIPFHDPRLPSAQPAPLPDQGESPFMIFYNVWKPTPKFKKSAPGPPDFRIAVVSAREATIPTLSQISALIESTPDDPPRPDAGLYQKLRHGYRNVILAVVDQGVVSYLRFADAGFGLENLYERKARLGGGKTGAGAGNQKWKS
ncbi:MAG: tRNA-splicing endonuclease subunit sen54 [Bogoriella megaspora]|nr:MAG: tRNA-splicing endonuclease subunit sen54 [Bogoriella megaspora]